MPLLFPVFWYYDNQIVLKPLINALKNDVAAVRLWSSSSLAEIGNVSLENAQLAAEQLLISLKIDNEPGVRSNCIWSLCRLYEKLNNTLQESFVDECTSCTRRTTVGTNRTRRYYWIAPFTRLALNYLIILQKGPSSWITKCQNLCIILCPQLQIIDGRLIGGSSCTAWTSLRSICIDHSFVDGRVCRLWYRVKNFENTKNEDFEIS